MIIKNLHYYTHDVVKLKTKGLGNKYVISTNKLSDVETQILCEGIYESEPNLVKFVFKAVFSANISLLDDKLSDLNTKKLSGIIESLNVAFAQTVGL